MRRLLIITITAFISKFVVSETLECAEPNELRTRIFDSLTHYQANKLPFNPLTPGWEGSNVGFNFSTLDTLQKNTFVTLDSQHILKIKLSAKRVKKIDEDAFFALDCLHELLLDNNDIIKLSRNTFKGLYHLKKLDLSGNHLKDLPDLVFANLPNLKILNLRRNQIKSVQVLAFLNLTLLEDLSLECNQIEALEKDVFAPLKSLKSLDLASNKLEGIEPEKWGGLENLEVLNLANNALTHFDPSYNFSFSNLKSLNLSSNYLTMLNVEALSKHFSNLGFIDLNNNPWVCSELEIFLKELQSARIKFASRNFSTSAVEGVACNEVPVFSVKTTTEQLISSTARKHETWSEKNYMEGIVEKKFKDMSDKVSDSISFLQNLIVFLYVLVGALVFFEIFVNTNCCIYLFNRLRGQNAMYFDQNDAENFRLLHR